MHAYSCIITYTRFYMRLCVFFRRCAAVSPNDVGRYSLLPYVPKCVWVFVSVSECVCVRVWVRARSRAISLSRVRPSQRSACTYIISQQPVRTFYIYYYYYFFFLRKVNALGGDRSHKFTGFVNSQRLYVVRVCEFVLTLSTCGDTCVRACRSQGSNVLLEKPARRIASVIVTHSVVAKSACCTFVRVPPSS